MKHLKSYKIFEADLITPESKRIHPHNSENVSEDFMNDIRDLCLDLNDVYGLDITFYSPKFRKRVAKEDKLPESRKERMYLDYPCIMVKEKVWRHIYGFQSESKEWTKACIETANRIKDYLGDNYIAFARMHHDDGYVTLTPELYQKNGYNQRMRGFKIVFDSSDYLKEESYNEDVRTRNTKAEYNKYRKEKLDDIKSDVDQIFEIEGLELSTKDFGNIYLDINFTSDTFIDPDEHREDFDRLIDYMSSRGYEFNYFDTYKVYWMGRMILTWEDLFNIPYHYKKQMNRLTIHFHNMKWQEEDAEYGINENKSESKFNTIKQDLIDLMTETMDDSLFEVDVDLYDYSNEQGSRWSQYFQTKYPSPRPQYNAGLRVTVYKTRIDNKDNSIKDDLERVNDYLKSQGVEIVNQEYKYSNNPGDINILPYKSDEFPKGDWVSVRTSFLLWI